MAGRLLAGSVVMVLLAGCGSGGVNDLNTKLNRYADNATDDSYNSGDNGASFRLPDGRTVFMVNDGFLGRPDANGMRPDRWFVSNGLVVWQNNRATTLLGPGRTAYLRPSEPSSYYWMSTAAVDRSDVKMFVQQRSNGGRFMGLRIITLAQSNLEPTGEVVDVPFRTDGPVWGHVIKSGGYWYIYGYANGGGHLGTYVARAPLNSLATPSTWTYYDGVTWSTSEAASRPIHDERGVTVPLALAPAVSGNSFVFLGRNTPLYADRFTWFLSRMPAGPVTRGADAYIPPEHTQPCGDPGGFSYIYALVHHPHLTSDPTQSVWSYSRACTTGHALASVYRPKFFSVNLSDAPATPAWRATWASPIARANSHFTFPNGFAAGTTLRQVVHTSRGGANARIRISNQFGTAALQVGAASIAPSADPATATKAVRATPTALTFAGQTSVTIPAGQSAVSDQVTAPPGQGPTVPADSDVAVTMHFPAATGLPNGHLGSLETSHTGPGNLTQNVDGAAFTGPSTSNSYYLAGLDVIDAPSGGTVVTLGDSLMEGVGTSTDGEARFTDALHDRLVAAGTPVRSVINQGSAGNHLMRRNETLPYSALGRFDTDVLQQPGVTSVIVSIGLNDLTQNHETASQLSAGFTELVTRAHAANVKVVLATITPLRGPNSAAVPSAVEQTRQTVNTSIRQNTFGADAFVDFDQVVRDPTDASRVNPSYSFFGGNHLNPAGYDAIAQRTMTAYGSL